MGARELSGLRATVRLRVRYGETDQMGVVYHSNYLAWFHEARDAMLAGLGVDASVVESQGFAFPVTESHCRYRSPAHYGEEVLASAVPVIDDGQGAGVARLRVRYRVESARGRRLLADGETVNVMTDRDGRLLLRLPPCFEPMVRRIEAACVGRRGNEV